MPFFASPLKVVFDPAGSGGTAVTLIEYDDYLAAWPQFSGGQKASLVDRVGASGRKGFSRLNEYSSVPLAWMRVYDTPELAFAAQMAWLASRPKRRATITFTPESGTAYSMADALLTNWNAKAEGCSVYFAVTIEGGQFATYP